MAVDFRCDKCGKLISVEAAPSEEVRCPHCQKKVVVPAGLASLPRPKVPPGTEAAPSPQAPPARQPAGQLEQQMPESTAMMGVMARIMPWVISVFFHLGLVLIMAFVTLFVIDNQISEEVVFPGAETPFAVVSMNPGATSPELRATEASRRTRRQAWAKREASLSSDEGKTEKRVELIGRRAGRGPLADSGLKRPSSAPGTVFITTPGNAHHIYAIDRSGSMLGTFDQVRQEMIVSISRLDPNQQDFHVILFAAGPPLEKDPRRLVPATKENKRAVARFLKQIRAEGETNPIPALRRAFQVLERADARPGKIIYLLTDGVFPDNEAVLQAIATSNKSKAVLINTYLYGRRPKQAEIVMKKIASENGGDYKYVSPEE